MSRRCKPGTRARVICGVNAGKIVVVVRRYLGEKVNDATWPKAMFPWVLTSLAGPLRSFHLHTGLEAPSALTIVLDDRDLEPLSDEDPGEVTHATRGKQEPTSASAPKVLAPQQF